MIRIIVLILILVSTVSAQDSQINIDYQRFVLENGLNVLLHEDHTTPTVSVNLLYFVGSGNEKRGKTGFAHLFEHLMWEGSANVPEGKFDEWLEQAGGNNNGSTNSDRTNYWDNCPTNALELALFLESDRLGYLDKGISADIVDGQRDVVKNERRQSYENRPYGMAFPEMDKNLFPPEHPYSWPTIGYMEDLSAASFQDVLDFYGKYYVPNNVSLAIAGDINIEETLELVKKWFGEIPMGDPIEPIQYPNIFMNKEKRLVLEDNVSLPRIYMAWLSPAAYTPGDAELGVLSDVLTGGKNSRLYKRLVYDLEIAQDVSSFQYSRKLGSQFILIATARAGHTLAELEDVIQEEIDKLKNEAPTEREVMRSINSTEAQFYSAIEQIGGFGGKAASLNEYFFATGNADYFNEDLARYKSLSPADIKSVVQTYLRDNGRFVLSFVPKGKPELAAHPAKGGE